MPKFKNNKAEQTKLNRDFNHTKCSVGRHFLKLTVERESESMKGERKFSYYRIEQL